MWKLWKRIMLVAALWTGSPVLAFASWDIFGAGSVATAVATGVKAGTDLAWNLAWLAALEKWLPVLLNYGLLALCIVAAIVVFFIEWRMLKDFKETFQTEMAQTAATLYNKIVLAFYTLLMTPTVIVLLGFGLFLVYAAYSGVDGIMHFKVPGK